MYIVDVSLRSGRVLLSHMNQALLLMSRPSVRPPRMLEKFHAEYCAMNRPLFPSSAPPIRDLLLFGVDWDWLSFPKLSPHLVNLRIHFRGDMNQDERNREMFSSEF